jgi:DNA-binding MarR family transcriptional regulator
MRPTAQRQSALRTPLNDILATEANVRMLRALAESDTPLTASELARRTRLQRSSVHRALKTLEPTGIVVWADAGGRSVIRLSPRHALAAAIRALFATERKRADSVFTGLRAAAATLRPPPMAVWLETPVADSSDEPGQPIVVRVVDDAVNLERAADQLRGAVEDLERRLDVTVEVRSSTPADLGAMPQREQARLQAAVSLRGVPPQGFLKWSDPTVAAGQQIRSHADLDARARRLAERVAQKVTRDPSLIDGARSFIKNRRTIASPGERKELDEWDRLLRTMSPARLRQFLVDPGERATRLRQSLPFVGVLSLGEAGDRARPARFDLHPSIAERPTGRSHMMRDVERIRRLSPTDRLREIAAVNRFVASTRRA